jgi:hypothetical protein
MNAAMRADREKIISGRSSEETKNDHVGENVAINRYVIHIQKFVEE